MLERYEAYKDSGVEWIGKVPAGWKLVRISSLYSARNEKVSDKDYAPLSVTMQGIQPQLETAAKTQDGDNRKLVKKGDFAINSRSDRRGSCGISQYNGSVSLITNVLKPKDASVMDRRFFGYLFKSERFSDEYYRQGTGIADDLWSTNWSRMKNILVCCPDHLNQKVIADYLDEKTAEIDDIVSETERSIELLREYRKSVISEAVTKGLDPNAPMKDSGVEWIGEIPETWGIKRTRYFVSSFRKGFGITKDEVSDEGDIFCVRYGEIYSKYNEKIVEIQSKTLKETIAAPQLIVKGNLLFACTGELVDEIGKNVLFDSDYPCLAGGDIIVVDHEQNPGFLNYSLGSYVAQCQKSFGKAKLKVVHITANELGNIRMPIPPLSEQQFIADYLDAKTSEIDALIADKERQVELLKEYRKSLISEAVTGKFKVPGVS